MIDSNLPIFISVADLGSFSRAGCQLKKSPQTIFRQISSFENKIGIKLFDRSPAGMKLTQAGRSFYKDARFLQSFAKEAVKRAKKIEKNSENLIRVAFSAFNSCRVSKTSLASSYETISEPACRACSV